MAEPDRGPERELARIAGLQISDYRCTARPGDPPFAERHRRSSIALVRRGTFCYHLGGRPHALYPGAVLLGDEAAEYACSHEHGTGDDCLVFSYDGPLLEEVLAQSGRRGARAPFGWAMLPPLPRLSAFFQMAEALLAGRPLPLGLDELGCLLAARVMEELRRVEPASAKARARPPRSPRSPRPGEVERLLAAALFVEENAARPLCLLEIARHAGLSPFHFLRLFRDHLGATPHQHLVRARVRHAAKLLLDTALPVTDIAYRVGFGDLSNFIRTFSALVGASPRRFRRGQLQESKRPDLVCSPPR